MTLNMEHEQIKCPSAAFCYSRLSRLASSSVGDFLINSADYSFWRTLSSGSYILVQLGSPGELICNADSRAPCADVHISMYGVGPRNVYF